MKADLDIKTVNDLLQLQENEMLAPNAEYQRGKVWNDSQQKGLIDSVMRGYRIPLIYLHHISTEVAGAKRERFEIIDGQQRIEALYAYWKGRFKLFDPVAEWEKAGFASFMRSQPCPWGGKCFDDLTPELQGQMLRTPLSVVLIETDIADEARDLFIRLQAGMPLNSQEKRDAWPGRFTEYIFKLAGKPEKNKIYPGHDFFKRVMKAKTKDRGQFRQLAAQMVLLYLTRRESGGLCDIDSDAIDRLYHRNLDFDPTSREAKRFSEILDLLTSLLGDGKRKKVIGHEAIGLVLLVDSLWDDYTRSWTGGLASAFDTFRSNMIKATKSRKKEPDEYWLGYGQFTRASTDRAENTEPRHRFFAGKMRAAIKPRLKDPSRSFGELERQLIYHRDEKKCQLPTCGATVSWSEAEIHHVESHAQGGSTILDNGALVHKTCHPKSAREVAAFADYWKTAIHGKGAVGPSEVNPTPRKGRGGSWIRALMRGGRIVN